MILNHVLVILVPKHNVVNSKEKKVLNPVGILVRPLVILNV